MTSSVPQIQFSLPFNRPEIELIRIEKLVHIEQLIHIEQLVHIEQLIHIE